MSDLNTLVQANPPLYLLTALAINDLGQIAGLGATSNGEIHGFLATPGEDKDGLSGYKPAQARSLEGALRLLWRQLRMH